MNTDIRLNVGFATHPKTVKLIRRLGYEGAFSLVALWTWAAQNRNSGVLSDMDDEDVSIAAVWNGEPETFVETLLALRFLERRDEVLHLHDWPEHQAYVVQEPIRRARGQKAALARWGALPGLPEPSDAEASGPAAGVPDAEPDHASGMPAPLSSYAPIPADPGEDHALTSFERASAPSGPDVPDAPRGPEPKAAPPCPHADIVALYHEVLPDHRRVAVLSARRRGALKARWADVGRRLRERGRPDGRAERLAWLRRFFETAAASDFLTGRLPGRDGRTYLVDFDKLMSPAGFVGVIEGKYRNREPA